MKSVIYKDGNSVIVESSKPEIKKNEVLIKTCASTICQYDNKIQKNKNQENDFKVLTGLEFSGKIEKVGESVKNFKEGSEVFGMLNLFGGARAHAEYIAVPENLIWHKPKNISFEEAATLPIAILTVFEAFVNIAKVKAGQQVLINGASGGVGIYAIKIAKALGASVTAVCNSKNKSTMEDLHVEKIIMYDQEDFTKRPDKYDFIFDVANNKTFKSCKNNLKSNGTYVSTNPFNDIMGIIRGCFSKQKVGFLLVSKGNATKLMECSKYIESGQIQPFVDKVFKFQDIQQAYTHFESGIKKGKIVINF